jgi:hypothetical protein
LLCFKKMKKRKEKKSERDERNNPTGCASLKQQQQQLLLLRWCSRAGNSEVSGRDHSLPLVIASQSQPQPQLLPPPLLCSALLCFAIRISTCQPPSPT